MSRLAPFALQEIQSKNFPASKISPKHFSTNVLNVYVQVFLKDKLSLTRSEVRKGKKLKDENSNNITKINKILMNCARKN